MAGVTKTVLVVLAIFIVAFLSGAEGGRDFSIKGGEVYSPQAFWFPHLPWWWASINKAESGPKSKGNARNTEVPQVNGTAGHGYLPDVDGMVSTEGEDQVYNPQAVWFRHFPWWWASINKAESGPKDIAKGNARNIEVPQVNGMAGHGYLPDVDGMVSTEGEDQVYYPQAFWFSHFHWWWPGSSKTEIRPEDKGKGETMNVGVPKIGGMAEHGYP